MEETLDIRIINGQLGMSGNNIHFRNDDFFGLKVGQKIVQIGDGRNNGSFRTDSFKEPLEYVGMKLIKFNKTERMYAFQLPEKIENENTYFIYGSTGSEIFTEATYSKKEKRSYVRFYKPIFFIR